MLTTFPSFRAHFESKTAFTSFSTSRSSRVALPVSCAFTALSRTDSPGRRCSSRCAVCFLSTRNRSRGPGSAIVEEARSPPRSQLAGHTEVSHTFASCFTRAHPWVTLTQILYAGGAVALDTDAHHDPLFVQRVENLTTAMTV